jgi:DNA-binding CsgD family transcriptional regulator
MVAAEALVVSPIGAVLDAGSRTIHIGPGVAIATVAYLASFTFLIVLGWGWLGRVWKTDRRTFMLGLLIFATIGYLESIRSFTRMLRLPEASQGAPGFLISPSPTPVRDLPDHILPALLVPASVEVDAPAFLEKYSITGREREIILMVVQGKSNVDIARELVVSLATVKTHLHNIYGKIGVKSRYDLLARVRSGQ